MLYLVFNEGYAATSGAELERRELAAEAIRMTRAAAPPAPDDPEVAGLLALMLLTDARHAARAGADGSLVGLEEQDRSRWDRPMIDEGVELLLATLTRGRVGPYQLQAAIAAVHDEAPAFAATDWSEIVGLYRLLEKVEPNPIVTLNHAVAVAMVSGPDAGLAMVESVVADGRLGDHHRIHLVRGHLLEMAGDVVGARGARRSRPTHDQHPRASLHRTPSGRSRSEDGLTDWPICFGGSFGAPGGAPDEPPSGGGVGSGDAVLRW